jgi:hypothetical protein
MFEHSDYLRDQAIKYRELAEKDKDVLAIKEFLELAIICEEVANDMDDRRVSGDDSNSVSPRAEFQLWIGRQFGKKYMRNLTAARSAGHLRSSREW